MNNRASISLILGIALAAGLGLVCLLPTGDMHGTTSRATWGSRTAGASQGAEAQRTSVAAQWGKLPLRFEANEGQAGDGAQFIARGPGYGVLLGGAKTTLVLDRPSKEMLPAHSLPQDRLRAAQKRSAERAVVQMELTGASSAAVAEGLEKLETETNYFIGNDPSKWHRRVANYARVKYREVYPGVDLVYYGKDGRLEYDLRVAAGANASAIGMRYTGAERMRVDRDGALVLGVKGSEIRQLRPKAYQIVGGMERPVEARYALRGNEVRFELAAYDRSRELVIDPAIVYSTYFGGNSTEFGFGIAIDGTGDVYLTGSTISTNLPATSTIGPVSNGAAIEDVFVVELNPTAHSIVFCDYIGGGNFDEALAVAVDGTGVYLGGDTASNNFPAGTTAGAQPAFAGTVGTTTNGWLAKLNSAGTALLYSTYLGGNGSDAVNNLTVDGSGNIYATGFTNSSGATPFPTSATAFQKTFGGTSGGNTGDAFVVKVNPAVAGAAGLVYSTYLGGAADEQGSAIAIDGSGNAFIAGDTNAQTFTAAFPSPPSAGVIQPGPPAKNAGGFSGWVAEVNSGATALTYFTYLGGNGDDHIQGMARDGSGNLYLTGRTASSNFPVMPNPGAAQAAFGGGAFDAFVTKINGTGTAITYSTYLGGSGDDEGADIRVDANGFAYVVGLTNSANFPVTANANQGAIAGAENAFIAKVRPTGTQVVYASYHGGGGTDFASKMAIDAANPPAVYFTGSTTSANFPATPNSGANAVVQTANGGGQDAFAVKIDASVPVSDLLPTPLAFGNQIQGTVSAAQTVTYTNNGNAPLTITSITASTDYTETDNCGAPGGMLAAGASCMIMVKFAPVVGPAGADNGTLTAVDNAAGSPHVVMLTGTFVSSSAVGSLTPTPLMFANQLVGTKSASQAVTYKNNGNSPLTINSIMVTGEYTETDNCGTPPSMLAAGASCTINVTFAPTSLPGGARNGTLTAMDNGTSSPEVVMLMGTATAPQAMLMPTSLMFANQNVGTSSAPQMATLTNNGNAPLNITSIKLFPQGAADFSQTNNCGASLAQGASCTFMVTFTPIGGSMAGQQRFGDIQIQDDSQPLFGQPTSFQFINLQGTGVTPAGGAFTLSAVNNAVTIHAGQTATFAVLVIPAGGFNQPVTFTCAGAPAHATCAEQPNPVALNGQNSGQTTVVVTTKGRGTLVPRPYEPRGTPPWTLLLLAVMMAALAAGMMFTPVRARMRYATPLALVILIVGLSIFASACASSGGAATPTGMSVLNVTGTGGGQMQVVNLTLNVVP